jgi:hypothetical protein
MAQSQNTVREILIGTAIATETSLDAFKDGAESGEIGIFSKNGTAVEAGEDFVIAQKTDDGVFVSDVIIPSKIKVAKATPYEAEQAKIVTISDIEAPEAGKDYIMDIIVYNAGSLSVENTHLRFAAYRAKTGDTVADVTAGLVDSLNRNFSRQQGSTATTNTWFEFGSTATTLTIESKPQPYSRGRKFGRNIEFEVLAKFDATVETTQVGKPGFGTGKQVAAMEYDLRKNRGDIYGDNAYPNSFTVISRASAGLGYSLVDIIHSRDMMDGMKYL